MNYQTLFIDKTTRQGPNFICRFFCSSSSSFVAPASSEQYIVLFVLAGGLRLFYDGEERELAGAEMVIAEQARISCQASRPNTIVMEYHLPAALTKRFETLPKAITPVVPITGRLEEWVEDRLLERPSGSIPEGDELVNLLILYQSRRMRTRIDALRNYAAESGFLRQLKPRKTALVLSPNGR